LTARCADPENAAVVAASAHFRLNRDLEQCPVLFRDCLRVFFPTFYVGF